MQLCERNSWKVVLGNSKVNNFKGRHYSYIENHYKSMALVTVENWNILYWKPVFPCIEKHESKFQNTCMIWYFKYYVLYKQSKIKYILIIKQPSHLCNDN